MVSFTDGDTLYIDVASQRFALQKRLAELPQFPITESNAERLVGNWLNRGSGRSNPYLETTVGPVITDAV